MQQQGFWTEITFFSFGLYKHYSEAYVIHQAPQLKVFHFLDIFFPIARIVSDNKADICAEGYTASN